MEEEGALLFFIEAALVLILMHALTLAGAWLWSFPTIGPVLLSCLLVETDITLLQ